MAYEVIYNATDLLIEQETVPSGTDAEGNPIYPIRRTWKKQVVNDPNVEDIWEDTSAQRILDKIADFQALVTTIENSPDVTSGNVVAQFAALKAELPDIIKALIYLGRRSLVL